MKARAWMFIKRSRFAAPIRWAIAWSAVAPAEGYASREPSIPLAYSRAWVMEPEDVAGSVVAEAKYIALEVQKTFDPTVGFVVAHVLNYQNRIKMMVQEVAQRRPTMRYTDLALIETIAFDYTARPSRMLMERSLK
jgi:hypothetical protein